VTSANEFLRAARCPSSLAPQEFGLWTIEKRYRPQQEPAGAIFNLTVGGDVQTALRRMTEATMHADGEVVMEDGLIELRRHLPIWLSARGRVLVTGLGLGCVVRGLLASSRVDHIDVVELDRNILEIVGAEFQSNPRVTLIRGDALTCDIAGSWDFAWHDIWCEGNGLQFLHVKLIDRFRDRAGLQGAWMLPRLVKRLASWPLIG
jgi:hypothetical protein